MYSFSYSFVILMNQPEAIGSITIGKYGCKTLIIDLSLNKHTFSLYTWPFAHLSY